jgi:hypothetical protein
MAALILDSPLIHRFLGLGLTIVLYLIDAISCTTSADCLIWDQDYDMIADGSDWSLVMFWFSLLILVPMFVYGIFKSLWLNKMWKTKVDVPSNVE